MTRKSEPSGRSHGLRTHRRADKSTKHGSIGTKNECDKGGTQEGVEGETSHHVKVRGLQSDNCHGQFSAKLCQRRVRKGVDRKSFSIGRGGTARRISGVISKPEKKNPKEPKRRLQKERIDNRKAIPGREAWFWSANSRGGSKIKTEGVGTSWAVVEGTRNSSGISRRRATQSF